METLSTVIKFVAGQGGGGGDVPGGGTGGEIVNSLTSGATGDFGFMLAAAIVLLVGACAVGAVLFQRKKASAGVHVGRVSCSHENKLLIPVIAIVTCVIALSVALMGFGSAKALADENAALTGNEIVGTVDPDTGAVTFSEATITNTSDKPQEIQEFVLLAAEGITTIDDVNWTIKIGDVTVFEGGVEKSEDEFEPITIEAGAIATMTVSVKDMSADLAKSLVGQDVAVANTQYDEKKQYYNGTVKAIDEPGGTAQAKEGIDVGFTKAGETELSVKATTTADGKYTLTGVEAGTAGKIYVVVGPSNTPYSAETIVTTSTSSATNDITTYKLTSLQTTIKDGASTGTLTERSTCWCPVLPNNKISNATIKFYNFDRELMSAGDDNEYSMNEIASTTKSAGKGEAYKSQANYFAWIATGQTLNCFQTVGMPWTEAFTKNDLSTEGVADDLKISDIKNRFTNTNNTFKTVYHDGTSWVEEWGNWTTPPTDPPHAAGYSYARKTTTGSPDNLADIYGYWDTDDTYKDTSGVLCPWAFYPWSARSYRSGYAFYWGSLGGSWYNDNKGSDNAVVVLQAFS